MSADQPDWDQLLPQACAGDHEAFGQLVLATQDGLRISIAVRSPFPDLVEEILQRTYVAAFQQLDRFRGEGDPSAWLKGIARNLLRRELRDRARHATACGDRLDQLLWSRAGQDADEDAALERRAERIRRLRACLDQVQPRAREMLHRHYVERTPVKRLAQQFKQTSDAISMRLFRLRRSLRACIEGERA